MVRAWWREHMDATRVVSLAALVAGSALFVLGATAMIGDEPTTFPWTALAIGIIFSINHRWRHRASGIAIALAWFCADMALYLGFIVGLDVLMTTLGPIVGTNEPLASNWGSVLGLAILLLGVSLILWKRDARTRRVIAFWILGLGLVFGGLAYAPHEPLLGMIAFLAGVAIWLYAVIKDPRAGPDPAESASPS